jgi:hypothetical protein
MVFNGDNGLLDSVGPWNLQDKQTPIVTEYRYLGILVNQEFSLERIINDRKAKGTRLLNSMEGFHKSSWLPVAFRKSVAKAYLIPVLTYGGELLGMNYSRAKPLQIIASQATRWIMGEKWHKYSTAALQAELGIPNVGAVITRQRIRAFEKHQFLSTWIATLIRYPAIKTRYRTWVNGTMIWLKKFSSSPTLFNDNAQCKSEMIQYSDGHNTNGFRFYSKYQFVRTRKYIDQSIRYLRNKGGIKWLMIARIGSLHTGLQLARMGQIHIEFMSKCPLCVSNSPEDLFHYLMECPRWTQIRESTLLPMLRNIINSRSNKRSGYVTETQPGEIKQHYSPQEMISLSLNCNSLSREECAAILLGGATTYEPDQSLTGYGAMWLSGINKSKGTDNCDESSQTKEHPLFVQVATFLEVTMREKMIFFSRLKVVWREQQTLESTMPLALQGADVPDGYGHSKSLSDRESSIWRWIVGLFNIP